MRLFSVKRPANFEGDFPFDWRCPKFGGERGFWFCSFVTLSSTGPNANADLAEISPVRMARYRVMWLTPAARAIERRLTADAPTRFSCGEYRTLLSSRTICSGVMEIHSRDALDVGSLGFRADRHLRRRVL
jgi:hypothetical protein